MRGLTMNKIFKNFDNDKIENVSDYVSGKLDEIDNCKVFVGTDSQVYGNYTSYAVAICMYNPGNGAHIIYSKEKDYKKKDRLVDRLWEEVVRTVEVANFLRENINDIDINTHFDVNPREEFRSNQIYKAAIGYANGANFDFEVKPESWAATCAADRIC